MPFATWGPRVGAYLVDALVTLPFGLVAYLVDGPTIDPVTAETTGGFGLTYVLLTLLSVAVHAYNRWYLAGKTGQSWGKRALGLRLLKEQTGQPIGFGMAFVRDLAHIVDTVICYIGFLFPLWDAKRQTLADKMTGTIVVRG